MKKGILSIIVTMAAILFFLNSTAALPKSAQAAPSNETEWRLQVLGLVEHPLNLTLSELAALPATTVQATIYCVGSPTQISEEGNWTGVKLGFLLEEAGVSPSATKVAFYASDGYSTDLSVEAATQPNVIVAYEKDGIPLSGTLRLVTPERWGYKWISQLTRIETVNYDFKGTWESGGYPDDGAITGTDQSSIPEFPANTILPLFLILSIFVVVAVRKNSSDTSFFADLQSKRNE
jgi:DMSO/TMAO reductase YedYZ molybdopterin-dependent catalytic subunit